MVARAWLNPSSGLAPWARGWPSAEKKSVTGPGLFGPAQQASDDPDDTTRLMAWLGRNTRPLT